MTLIDLVIWIAGSTSIAFCFAFPFQGPIRISFGAGFLAAIGGMMCCLVLFGIWFVFDKIWLLKKILPQIPQWKFNPVVFAYFWVAAFGFVAVRHSTWAVVGFPAVGAAVLTFVGPSTWRKRAAICWACLFLLSIALHFLVTPALFPGTFK